jgi:exodeoxyribonuclease V alpha subunit
MSESITFKAKIEKVVFYSDSSAWGCLSVSTDQDIPYSKQYEDYDIETNLTTQKYITTIVGKVPHPEIGMVFDIIGHHTYNQKYKQNQYEIESIFSTAPKTVADQSAYLQSLLTKNQADVLLEYYPNIVQDIIDGVDNVDLSLLKGIGQITYDKIKEKVIGNFAISDIVSLLIPLGISFKKIQKLLDGERNPEILRQRIISNPYRISEIDGISFKVADKIATQLNPKLKESEERLVAFIQYFLSDIGENQGHTYITKDELRNGIIENVTECERFLDNWILKESLENEGKGKIVHVENEKVGLKRYWDSEIFIWNKIIELDKTEPLLVTEENINNGIRIAEEQLGFTLTEEQKEVVINMTKSNFALSTGKSGTGKTTTARALLNIYKDAGYSVVVAAFSAKAARRATEATGVIGFTLHKLLGIGGESEDAPIPFDFLFVDENSMNPLHLMKHIFEQVGKKNLKIVLCGDSKQINPLGVGNIFSDLLEKDCFNKNVLTKIQRQAADSGIIVDGNQIRDGIDPVINKEPRVIHGNKKDLIYVFKNDKEEIFRLAVSSYVKSFREKGIGNTVLLVPFKSKGLNSTKEFNKIIQKEINSENQSIQFNHGDLSFWLNDYVIHLKNNYEKGVMNGSSGIVKLVESNRIVVDFDGEDIEYTHDDIGELGLAYALTTHKFQGSETKDVIVVMDGSHWILLSNSWLYTSMTRSRERCLIITDTNAYNRCMQEDKSQRSTWMKLFEIQSKST